MDRRAAGALLALAACFACSAAAPTASNQTALDLYESAPEGCYYNFQHYGEGDRIMTNEPCLNCTCHNRMLMCYLRVCPFTKAIGQDCTVEKRADQCCPIVTCPDVPVDLLTSTSTTSPAEYGATGLGKLDRYGCSINGKYFPEGSKVPPTPNKPCEHCYCIRNMTTCVMQECTLHVDGCTPIYHKDVCCPVRYSCDHPEDEVPLLDDMSTTVRPTPGFLLTTTTMSPVTQMTQDCVHDDQVFSDGALIKTEKACEHCYCMKGDIVCVVQECGAPMENEGKNCTSLPPREGQCCPDTYICEGDELSSDLPTESTTESIIEKLTTLSPPRRTSVEGSGYRIEPDEASYTEMPILEPEVEGSGDIEETPKPIGSDDILPTPGDDEQYIYVTSKGPAHEEHEKTTVAVDKDMITDLKDKTDESHVSTSAPISEEVEKPTTSNVDEISEPHKVVPTTKAPEMYESGTTELGDLQNTVPDVIPDEEIAKPQEYAPSSTYAPTSESQHTEDEDDKLTTSLKEQDITKSTTSKSEYSTTSGLDEIEKETSAPTVLSNVTPEVISEKEYTESDITRTTSATLAEESPAEEDKETTKSDILAASITASPAEEGKETTKPDLLAPGTTISPAKEERETYKPDILTTSTTTSPAEEEKETTKSDLLASGTTISPAEEDKETYKPEVLAASSTTSPAEEEKETTKPDLLAPGTTISPAEEDKETYKPEILAASSTTSPAEEEKETTKPDLLAPDEEDKETYKPDLQASITTISPTDEEKHSLKPEEYAPSSTSKPAEEEKEISEPEHLAPITTSSPLEEEEMFITEPDHALNTVAVAEEESKHPYEHIPTTVASHEVKEEGTTVFSVEPEDVTDKIIKEDTPTEYVTTAAPVVKETELTTAEPDRGLNTIPSEIYEETSSEPSLPGKTTIYEDTRRTESSPITDEQQTQGVDSKSTSVSELTTPLPESIATKGDQFTVTTEPSFRKEDEVIVSSEKPKETEPTTVKSEFVDEGLIPTSSHDDKISTSSDVPMTEEEFTTLVPEYDTELTETSGAKQTTTESAKETPVVTEIVPDQDGSFPSSTEKLTEITPLVEIHEEPSRIPGEGDCLLNGVTYKNNTVVPSTNNCHTGCRCASSIIKCDPIICSSPPDYMDNCQSIYDSPDSCCPTFVCDHPRETVPPQSDNQMSGTESPMPSPTIECRGDQCEISVPTKQPLTPSELCTSGSCLPESDHKIEAECGSEGCGGVPQKPDTSLPSGEHVEECSDGKCKPETEVSPVTPCEGDNCQKTGETGKPPESPQQCKNGEECKTLEIPSVDATTCEGDSCKKIDCGDGGCGTDVITSPPEHQLESCKEEDGCKPQDIPIPECTGDEPCRRKETSDSDAKPKPPTTCEGPNCISEKTTTEQIPSAEVTERIVTTEGITATEISEDHISNENIPVKDAQEMDMYTTERPTADSEGVDIEEGKPVIEDDVTKKPTFDEEKGTEMPTIDEGVKEKPTIEKDVTDTPEVVEQETAKPTTTGKEGEEKPVVEEEKSPEVPVTVKDEVTKEPTLPGDKDKDKPAVSEEESTEVPTIDVREGTENPAIGEEGIEGKPIVDEGSTKQPDTVDQEDKEKQHIDKDSTKKPDLVEEEGTTKPIITEEQATTISITEEKATDVPAITDQFNTDISAVSDADTEKPSFLDEERKPTDVDEKDTEKTEQKPIVETSSEQPDHEREGTDKPAVEEEVTKTPDVIKQETTVKPIDVDNEFTDKPTHDEEKGTEIPALATEGGEKELMATEEGTEKPVIIEGEPSEKPIVEEKDKIPAVVEKEVTEEPTAVEKDTEKPLVEPDDKTEAAVVDQESTEKTVISDVSKPEKSPEIEEDQVTVKPVSDENKSTERTNVDEDTEEPTSVDKDTKKPDFIETESTKEPSDIDKQVTEVPTSTGEENTKEPDVIEEEDITKSVTEEDTMKPFTIKEDSTAIPDFTKEEGTAKPVIIDEGTEEPAIIEKEDPTKTTAIEKEGTELPGIIGEEPTAKPDMAGQEGTKTPAVVEEGTIKPGDVGTEEPSIFENESTEKPVISEDKDHKKPEKEKPVIIDEEITDKPTDNEVVSSEKPITHKEEGSGTEIPETILTTESDKEVKSPELTAQPTQSTITEIEKTTKIPYSESQTTLAEPNAAEPIDVSTPETKVTEAEGSYSQEPVIHDHSRIPEISTEPLSEQEITTKASVTDNDKKTISEQDVEATTFKLDTFDVKVESSTVGQDLIDEEPALVTKTPELPKTSESVEKMTDSESTSDREEVFTDKSDIEFPTTKAPGTGPSIIEPQDGVETEEPEQHVTSKFDEDSTTKVYEDEKMKPVPESHVTETSSASPEYEPSYGVTDVSPTADEHKPKPDSPEQHGTQPDKETTQAPVVEVKTDHPEIHSSEKEETITETSEYSVTEPVRRFTEIEDPSVTGQEDIVTGYPEHYVPSGTDKTDVSGDDGIPSSEKPLLTDMEMELPEKSTESDKFVTKMPEQDYQTPGKEKPTDEFETPVTEIPISVVTEPQLTSDIPEKDLTKYEEKTTIVPDLSDHKHIDTTLPEGHTEQQEPVTAIEEQNKATVPNLEEPNVTELQETSTKTVEEKIKDTQATTTAIPRTEEEIVTTAPEQIYTESHDLEKTEPSITEIQKVSTDLPVEEVQTELPGIQMSSEVPQSLVTGQPEILGEETTISSVPKEEISETPEKQKPGQEETRTEVPIHVTEPAEISTVGTKEQEDKMPHAPEESVTEKQESELPAVAEKIDQIDVMKPTEHTSAQTEFSETTPYLIELEEHTHKIVEDFTTASPSVEEHSYKPVEDTSIPSFTEEEHSYKPVEDISTSSPAEEEHSQKPVDDISTSSPTEDEELHKPVKDDSTSSPIVEEYSHKPVEEISIPLPSDEEHSNKPVKDISTSSPSEEEHSHKPVEEISTPSPSDEEHSYKPVEDISTSSPSEEEHSHKPVEDVSTPSSSDEEHSYKPVEDILTSLPSEEEHSHKPVEDISTPSPSDEEHSYKPVEDISTSSPTADEELRKPVEDITISSPSEEDHSHKPIEDISTSSPLAAEHSYKPVQDISTLSPSEEDDLHKPVEDISTTSPSEEEHSIKPIKDISTSTPPADKDTFNIEEHLSTVSPYEQKPTTVQPYAGEESTSKKTDEEIETATKEVEGITKLSEVSLPEDVSEKVSEPVPVEETTPAIVYGEDDKDHKEYTTSAPTQPAPAVVTESEKLPTSESDIATPTEKETSISEKPIVSHETTVPEEEFIFSTTKPTTVRQGEDMATSQHPDSDKLATEPEDKPSEASEIHPPSTTTEVSKPSIPDLQSTDEIPVPDDDGHFSPSGTSGYGEPDYVEEDQAFGPGTCRYGGKVYVSAQQIPRDDPCDFCFCFRSDIICLQQSCPPPIHGCHEEPIQGFCCPRYECPVSMATTVNVTTTTTTTTTTLPPHFPTHSYKGAAQRRGCQIKGHTYKVGEVVRSSSGPCLHCTCGGDGQMKCDPKACTPEPMLRQMIAAAVSAKRRR